MLYFMLMKSKIRFQTVMTRTYPYWSQAVYLSFRQYFSIKKTSGH